MKNFFFACLYCIPILLTAQVKLPASPDKIYGQFFMDVQLGQVFPDQKTFADCTPKRKIADIMYDYGMMKGPGMDLQKFVADNFNLPPAPPQLNYIQQEKNVSVHIKNLWSILKREADVSPRWEGKPGNGSSLLALPYPYIVPGGRFREIHYWDSYFTMLGLQASNETVMMENMVKDFDYLIDAFGHVPAGSRSYYLSRSGPPFFCMMVNLLASVKGKNILKQYLPSMLKEYAYWMDGAGKVKKGGPVKYVVMMPDGSILNRYWDENNSPRPENYKQDTEIAEAAAMELAMRIKVASPEQLKEILDRKRSDTYRELRAAACSGWDGSSRWCAEPGKMISIQATGIIPVDLNCLLYNMETIIAAALKTNRQPQLALQYSRKAAKRKAAILKYCWNKEKSFFVDYNMISAQQSTNITPAGLFPLFVKIATPPQAAAVAKTLAETLLKEGGIVNTTNNTGELWDAPNAVAPLQWVAVTAFKNYGNRQLAKDIAMRWLALTDKVYLATGRLTDRYNAEEITKEPTGGTYPLQDGFASTNSVYLALKKLFPIP